MDERLKILNNITEITKDNIPIEIKSICLEFSCNKYSSKKNSIYHITLNDKHLSKRDTFNIKYKCVTCEANHIVGTTQFLRKINKCSYRCCLCVNKDDIKRLNHSYYLSTLDNKDTKSVQQTSIVPLSLKEQKYESDMLFDEYDDDFKDNYYTNHLTDDDYKRIFFDYNQLPNPSNTIYISDKDLKKYLEFCLKEKLNNPKSIFNSYNVNTITVLVCILWFIIIIQIFNILYYYYRDIYSYILLFITILTILIAIIWKMIYILNVD